MNLANTRLRLILLPLIHVVNGGLIKHISWHVSTSAFILSLIRKNFRSSLLMVSLVNRTLWSEYSNCKVKISKWIFQHQCRASANQKNITQLCHFFTMLQYLVNYICCKICHLRIEYDMWVPMIRNHLWTWQPKKSNFWHSLFS